MKFLIYAILRDGGPVWDTGLPGVEGTTVGLVREAGLAAACSAVPDACGVPNVDRAMAYGRVVEALHEAGPVLPLRYGCTLDTEAQVAELLRTRGAEFLASLAGLEACVEMGVRVLLHEPMRLAAQGVCPPSPAKTGLAYLAGRRAHYAEQDGALDESHDLAERARNAFDRLFVQFRSEHSLAAGRRVLSLYFLVRREHEAEFRKAFQGLQDRCSERLLLSGPWPPYNFAGVGTGTDSIEAIGEFGSPGQVSPASLVRATGLSLSSVRG
jgi:hypothetical protein